MLKLDIILYCACPREVFPGVFYSLKSPANYQWVVTPRHTSWSHQCLANLGVQQVHRKLCPLDTNIALIINWSQYHNMILIFAKYLNLWLNEWKWWWINLMHAHSFWFRANCICKKYLMNNSHQLSEASGLRFGHYGFFHSTGSTTNVCRATWKSTQS